MATRNTKKYNSGTNPIKPEDLLNDEAAITLLMKDYETMEKELIDVKEEKNKAITDLAVVQAVSKFRIYGIICNAIAAILIGVGTNLLTSSNVRIIVPIVLLVLGIALEITMGVLIYKIKVD